MDDKGQMMILESIFFAITVIIALAFLVQISPTSIQTGSQSSNDLKILGDSTLDAIYADILDVREGMPGDYSTNNPRNKLTVCIITNNYAELVNSLNAILPDTVLYNIYISNGVTTVFWCTPLDVVPFYDTATPQTMYDPVAISHHPISIDLIHMIRYNNAIYDNGNGEKYSDIALDFLGDPGAVEPYFDDSDLYEYKGSSYEVILELSDLRSLS